MSWSSIPHACDRAVTILRKLQNNWRSLMWWTMTWSPWLWSRKRREAFPKIRRHLQSEWTLRLWIDSFHVTYSFALNPYQVAEKIKVIAVMDKERAALHKVHKQYQKERVDQDSLENEFAEKIRKVNEELRVAKARMQKYRWGRCVLACDVRVHEKERTSQDSSEIMPRTFWDDAPHFLPSFPTIFRIKIPRKAQDRKVRVYDQGRMMPTRQNDVHQIPKRLIVPIFPFLCLWRDVSKMWEFAKSIVP